MVGKTTSCRKRRIPSILDMNKGYEQEEKGTSSLATELWWVMDTKRKGKLY